MALPEETTRYCSSLVVCMPRPLQEKGNSQSDLTSTFSLNRLYTYEGNTNPPEVLDSLVFAQGKHIKSYGRSSIAIRAFHEKVICTSHPLVVPLGGTIASASSAGGARHIGVPGRVDCQTFDRGPNMGTTILQCHHAFYDGSHFDSPA